MEDFATIASGFPEPFRLLIKETCASTNDEVRILAEAGTPEGLVILAHQQTQGRGRRGTAWFSPAGESLAFSILIRPSEPKTLWPRLALVAGLCVAEALEQHFPLVGIKWPNDLWIHGKKIAGILVEAGRDHAVIGIGLNVSSRAFPPEISATSLAHETGNDVSRPDLLAAIIGKIAARRHQIGAGFSEVIEAIRLRCVLTGHHVSLTTPTGPLSGKVETITAQGELLLRTATGLVSLLQADEVRLHSGAGID